MKHFVIAQIEVNNDTLYEDYKKLTPGSLQNFEGKFIVRGGAFESVEGEWQPQRMVVIEFPSKEKAHAWWNSEEYKAAKQIRQQAADSKILIIAGLEA